MFSKREVGNVGTPATVGRVRNGGRRRKKWMMVRTWTNWNLIRERLWMSWH
jgi:hypothetical protein